MVGTRYFASAPNGWYSIWYCNYGRTWSITSLPGLVFRRRRVVFILLAMPRPRMRAALGVWSGWFKLAWNQPYRSTNDRCEALASPKGCFLCFYFCPPVFIHWTEKLPNFSFNHLVCLPKTKGGWIRISRLFCYLLWRWRGLNPRPNVELISFLHA